MRIPSESRREALGLAVLIAAAVALFAPSLGYDLTFDDLATVVEHPGVQSPHLSLREIFLRDWWGHRFGDPDGVPTYRPLVTLTFWFDRWLGGGAKWVFHASNLAVYAALLFTAHRFLRAWAGDALGPRGRLAVVALFASLAIHADVVPSVTGRGEMMTMLFTLVAMRWATTRESRIALAGAGAAFVAALLCKESAVPLVLATPFFALRQGRTRGRSALIALVACAAVAALLLFRVRVGLPIAAAKHVGVEEGNPLILNPGFFDRLPGALDVLSRYLLHAGTGVDLCPDYSYAEIVPSTRWASLAPLAGAALAALGVAMAVLTARRAPRVCDALVGFLASYAVISHLAFPATATLADRLFFFPSFWLLTAVALGVARAPERLRRLALPVAAAFVVMQSALLVAAARMWRSPAELALHTVSTCPHNGRGRWMRAHSAYLARDVETTAWQLIAQAALYSHFPRPLPAEELSAEWEALPFVERLRRLRAAEDDARYRQILLRGASIARASGYLEAERFIRTIGAGAP